MFIQHMVRVARVYDTSCVQELGNLLTRSLLRFLGAVCRLNLRGKSH